MRYRRYFVPGGCYFFTVVTENRQKILTLPSSYAFLQEAFDKVKQDRPFVLEALVILPDHLHCIWKLPPGDFDFSTRWRLIKTRFTKQHRSSGSSESQGKHFQKKNQKKVWQNRYWEHFLRDEDDYRNHIDYIHFNPVKHGYVQSPTEWPFSSFHNYVKSGLLPKNWGSEECKFQETIGME